MKKMKKVLAVALSLVMAAVHKVRISHVIYFHQI